VGLLHRGIALPVIAILGAGCVRNYLELFGRGDVVRFVGEQTDHGTAAALLRLVH